MEIDTAWRIALLMGGSIFLGTFTLGIIFTGCMCRLSRRWDALDKPDGFLKCHVRPTATLGGIPIFAALIVGAGIILIFSYDLSELFAELMHGSFSWGALLVAAGLILSIGICDDLRQVMPRTKLLFQLLAATVLIGSGLVIRQCGFFADFHWSLGLLAVPFTLFWLIGSCNAFNFIDGMDGLAPGLGVVASLVLALLGFINEAYLSALLALALAGSLFALLLFNIKPAAIFLGDSGSQLVGLLLGVLSIKTATFNGVFILPTPVLVLSIPIIDAFLSILRRYSRATSPACGDHKHIHHCLRRLGLSVRETSMTLWVVALACGIMGLVCHLAQGMQVALAGIAFLGVEFYLGVRLGCLDCRALYRRITGQDHKGTRPVPKRPDHAHLAQLAKLWEDMKPLFEQMQLDRAILTLEKVNEQGRCKYETYQWVRSENLLTELLRSRWTKRFALGGDEPRIATLQLESAERFYRDERRIDWLLQQISENMRFSSLSKTNVVEELVQSGT